MGVRNMPTIKRHLHHLLDVPQDGTQGAQQPGDAGQEDRPAARARPAGAAEPGGGPPCSQVASSTSSTSPMAWEKATA